MADFKQTLYMKRGCPFCTKLSVFLADAGINDKVVWAYDTDENREAIKGKLGKVTFPTLETAKGEYMLETNDIIDRLAKENGVDKTKLQVFQYFTGDNGDDAMFKTFMKLVKFGSKQAGGHQELFAELKKME